MLAAAISAAGQSEQGDRRDRLRPLPEVSQNLKTGPAVGAKIPAFQLPDQSGTPRSLKDLSGPKGLVLAFVRSADW